MIKVKVIEEFYLEKFAELKNITRASAKNTDKYLYVGDVFECNEEMADYLIKDNRLKRPFVEVVEVIPEEKPIEEVKEEKKKPNKKTSKKSIAKK